MLKPNLYSKQEKQPKLGSKVKTVTDKLMEKVNGQTKKAWPRLFEAAKRRDKESPVPKKSNELERAKTQLKGIKHGKLKFIGSEPKSKKSKLYKLGKLGKSLAR